MKKLSKKDKLLITLCKKVGEKNNIRIEDVMVYAFELFPADFQLKNYPKFLDSELIRRALYSLIPEGYLIVKNGNCFITELGFRMGTNLIRKSTFHESLSRGSYGIENEIIRIVNLQGYQLFLENKPEGIVDQDFYDFFRSSVRTTKLEIQGKIKNIESIINYLDEGQSDFTENVASYKRYLLKRFHYLLKDHENGNKT